MKDHEGKSHTNLSYEGRSSNSLVSNFEIMVIRIVGQKS